MVHWCKRPPNLLAQLPAWQQTLLPERCPPHVCTLCIRESLNPSPQSQPQPQKGAHLPAACLARTAHITPAAPNQGSTSCLAAPGSSGAALAAIATATSQLHSLPGSCLHTPSPSVETGAAASPPGPAAAVTAQCVVRPGHRDRSRHHSSVKSLSTLLAAAAAVAECHCCCPGFLCGLTPGGTPWA